MFLVAIQVEALDRHRLLSDVTRVLADEKVNILSASVTTSDDRVAISRFTFEMGDPKHLGHLLNVVRNVEGVYDVYRVTSAGLASAPEMKVTKVEGDDVRFYLTTAPTKRSQRGARQPARTDLIVTSVTGLPSSLPSATPAAAIMSRAISPGLSIVPNTV